MKPTKLTTLPRPWVPELPEVETLRRDLDREVVGRKIKDVEVINMRMIRRHRNRKQFTSRLEGLKITGIDVVCAFAFSRRVPFYTRKSARVFRV